MALPCLRAAAAEALNQLLFIHPLSKFIMQFNFFGQFTGSLCNACSIPFTHGIVRLYQQAVDDAILTHVVAPTKDTLRVLQSDEEKALGAKLLGSGAVDAHGNYRLVFDGDKRRYEGGPVLVVLELTHITPMQGPESKHPAISYAVTTLHPRWELSRNQTEALARFDHCFSERLTCAILKHFDIWVISGRVVSCDNPNLPAAGVTVTAMDADLITDDRLGSAVTDSQGRFRITYRSRDFKRTFLSPFINIETLGAAGPDLYFLVTGQGGVELLTETKQDGKRHGRKDVGNCFCVNLCIPAGPTPPPPAMVWTGVGDKFTLSTAGNRNDFDDEGYAEFGTGSNRHKYAIHDITFMTGQKPNPLASGNPIEYRFRIARTTTANNLPALPETAFTQVINETSGLFYEVPKIGTLIRWTPSFRLLDVKLKAEDVDADGWVDVRKAVQRTLEEDADFDPADLRDPAQFWQWKDADEMIGLNTTRLTAQGSRPNFAALLPGARIPDAQYYPIEKIAIRFEIRDQVTRTPLPGNGVTLNAMVVNNDRAVAKLGVVDGKGLVTCDKFKNEPVSIAYTIYHPHVEYAAIKVFDADNRPNPFFDLGRPINNTTRPLVVAAADSKLELPAIGQTCNYRATLGWQLLLHNGYAADEAHGISVPFYYEV